MSSSQWTAKITLKNTTESAAPFYFGYATVLSGNVGFPVVGEPTLEPLASRGVPGVRYRNTGNRVENLVIRTQEPVTGSAGQGGDAYQTQMRRLKTMVGQTCDFEYKRPGSTRTTLFVSAYIVSVSEIMSAGRMIGFGSVANSNESVMATITIDLNGPLLRDLLGAAVKERG